ncbi:MAG: penicillin acylase family protein, partial [Flavisolibacter sp.]
MIPYKRSKLSIYFTGMRFLIIVFLPFFSLAQSFSSKEINRFQKQAANVTIIRDHWGVPHIYGKTDADAVFGLMYAQAEENFDQVEMNFLEMLGRLSEVHGESRLYQDLQVKLIYDTVAAQRDYRNSPPWLKKLLDASADGLNFYLHKNPHVKPRLIHRFQPWYALLRTDGSIGATQTGGLTLKDMREMYPSRNAGTSFHPVRENSYVEHHTGSNGFAVGPSRTASGNAILYINPHTSFFFRPEVHIVSDEGLNAYGAVTWGTFFIYQGFNEYCGWMHTSSYADVADLYEEKIIRKGDLYLKQYDQQLLPLGKRLLHIRVKKEQGTALEVFETYTTNHGPVVGSRDGKWLSLKENNRSMESLMQSWLRTKAKGFDDYRRIMDMRVNNSNNTVFADNKGNIAYWHGNFMPKRN